MKKNLSKNALIYNSIKFYNAKQPLQPINASVIVTHVRFANKYEKIILNKFYLEKPFAKYHFICFKIRSITENINNK